MIDPALRWVPRKGMRGSKPSGKLRLGYQTDKNRRSSMVFCIEGRPDPCVYGHERRISCAIRRMLMRLALLATAWSSVGMPLMHLTGSEL
jgi:hypothetical protein